tara:strand:+ start:1470 stop:5222 length:3753 start_codon:yes stop_codon:yes gene_type:complete
MDENQKINSKEKKKMIKKIKNKKLLDEIKLTKTLNLFSQENQNVVNQMFLTYPHISDPSLQSKITLKKEFFYPYDGKIKPIKKEANEACFKPFTLSNHQKMIKHFMSSQTPYNGLLLYHGLGSGKTCSAIGVTENMRKYMELQGKIKRIIIVASPNVQENFRLQLFDYTKLVKTKSGWEFSSERCQGQNFLDDLSHINTRELSLNAIIQKVNKIINKYYLFMGYIEFANYIKKKIDNSSQILNKNKEFYIKKKLNSLFKNRLLVIDEIHNIRATDDNLSLFQDKKGENSKDKKKVASQLLKLIRYVDQMKLLFLSATPMYNDPKEIVFLLNILNMNDKRPLIHINDIFDKNDNLKVKDGKEIGKELLILKSRGYISYVRGENPYTFPYAVFPKQFENNRSLFSINYPSKMFNGNLITEPIKYSDLYVNIITGNQEQSYLKLINDLKRNMTEKEMEAFSYSESFGYNMIMKHLECLNMSYPIKENQRKNQQENENENIFNNTIFTGKKGLKEFMTYKSSLTPPSKNNFRYRDLKTYGRIFSMKNIASYSVKIFNIMNEILKSKGIVLVYSQYIDSGIIPLCLALEELGFKRYGEREKSLFYQDKQDKNYKFEKRDSQTMKLYSELKKYDVKTQASYVVISGDASLSPNNNEELISVSSDNNKYGSIVKVVLISQAGSEGLDFKNIRQVHLLEPWYNRSRLEQVIGRAIRNCSHKNLPFEERNVCIYQHVCMLESNPDEETADLLTYRKCETKDIKISKVKRILKENSIDCNLNYLQTVFADMKQEINLNLSNGEKIKYNVGDKPFTSFCDYSETCHYTCMDKLDITTLTNKDLNITTLSEDYYQVTFRKIFEYLRGLFKEQSVYKIEELINSIIIQIEKDKDTSNSLKINEVTKINILYALNEITNNQNYVFYDKYNRSGHIINIDYLFLFTPFELSEKLYSSYEYFHKITRKEPSFEIVKNKNQTILDQTNVNDKNKDVNINTSKFNKIEKIYKKIIDKYNIILQNHHNLRGVQDIDKHFYFVYETFHSNNSIDAKDINQIVCSYLIEYLSEKEIIDLGFFILTKLWDKKTEEFETKFKLYEYIYSHFRNLLIEPSSAEDTGKYAIYFYIKGKNELYIIDTNIQEIREINIEDERDFSNVFQKYIFDNREKLNNIIGYVSTFKDKSRVFKTKIIQQQTKGARCDNQKKGEIVEILNKILGREEYNKTNVSRISRNQLCLLQEMYLRYFNLIKKNDKIWFLTESQDKLFLN